MIKLIKYSSICLLFSMCQITLAAEKTPEAVDIVKEVSESKKVGLAAALEYSNKNNDKAHEEKTMTEYTTKLKELASESRHLQLSKNPFYIYEDMSTSEVFMTDGRFLIKDPKIIDLWTASEVRSYLDIDKALRRISPEAMGISRQKISTFLIGNPNAKKGTMLLVDPSVSKQRDIVSRYVEKYEKLTDEYLSIVLVPSHPDKRNSVHNYICSPDMLHSGIGKYIQKEMDMCKGEVGVKRGLALARTFQIKGLPLLLTPQGDMEYDVYSIKEYIQK